MAARRTSTSRSTRALTASAIGRSNVASLHVAWRFRFHIPLVDSGAVTATPVVAGGRVYIQDMRSNVYALDLASGRLVWRRSFGDTNPGPNGLALAGGRVYGATDTTVFALSAANGRLLWTQDLVTPTARFVDVAPQVAAGTVYSATIGLPPAGRGVLYAIDARTGRVRWKLDTIKGRWAVPGEAGGGGAWYPPSVDGANGVLGHRESATRTAARGSHPNGGAFAGAALYTDSLLAVDGASGTLAWYDQVTPHDVRDHDFQLSPVLGSSGGRPAVFGAGKGGLAVAWDRATHERLWQTEVGVHRNDSGPLPPHRVPVCPGLLRRRRDADGVRLRAALSPGREPLRSRQRLRLRGPLHGRPLARNGRARGARRGAPASRCGAGSCRSRTSAARPSATASSSRRPSTARSTGSTPRSGAVLWKTSLPAGVNACPALASQVAPRSRGHRAPARRRHRARRPHPELTVTSHDWHGW